MVEPPSISNVRLDRDITLIVEGRTDQIFLQTLVEYLGISPYFDIAKYDGIQQLPPFLKLIAGSLRRDPTRQRTLAIIRDAEQQSVASVQQSVAQALHQADLPSVVTAGSISSGELRVGLFVFPDNREPGMLEDLCLRSIPRQGDVRKCLDAYFHCMNAIGSGVPEPSVKARTAAYLTALGLAEPLVGRAAQKRVWNFDHEAFIPLIRFLRSLHDPEAAPT